MTITHLDYITISNSTLALLVIYLLLFTTLIYYLIKSVVYASDSRETIGWGALIFTWVGLVLILGINMQVISASSVLELTLVALSASLAIAAIYLHTTSSTSPLSP